MKKFLILSAAVAAIAAAGPAMAEMATVTTDLNVRAGPGTGHPVIGVVGAGQSVDISGCTGGWCSVALAGGGEGWLSAKYLAGGSDVIISDETTSAVRVDRPRSTPGGRAGVVVGGASGAVAGAVVGGPIGAAVGGVGGAIVGGTTGRVLDPPARVRTYVTSNRTRPAYIQGDVAVGTTLPDTVVMERVPDYEYDYVYVNDRPMLVEPGTRRVVYVYQ